jgi:uncharacterized protein (DUF885 family)
VSAETSPAGPAGDAAAADREPGAPRLAIAQFRRLAEDYLGDLAHRHPDIATELGDHRYDHRLPDHGAAALDDECRGLDEFAARLAAIDRAGLDKELLVDAAVLGNAVDRRLFEIIELREHEWNPLLANPGQAIYTLLARDYAPLADRLRSLAGRLAAVPAALADARGALGRMPKVHLETAIAQFGGTIALVTEEVNAALRQAANAASAAASATGRAAAAEVERTRPAALAALAEHRDWLSARLEADDPGGGGGGFKDPRLGRDLFSRKLSLALSAASDADAILARAEADLERVTGEITEVAAELGGAPPRPTRRPSWPSAPTRSPRRSPSSATMTWSRCTTTRSRSSTCRRSTGASRSPTATRPGCSSRYQARRSSRSHRRRRTGRPSASPPSTASTTGTWCTT